MNYKNMHYNTRLAEIKDHIHSCIEQTFLYNYSLETSLTLKKWITVLGTLLLMLPIGLPWYWGNMSVYAVSYVAVRGESLDGIETPWIISFYFMFNALGLFIAGTVSKHTDGKHHRILSFGIALFLGGFFLTYYSVQESIVLMNTTLGVISGLGGGVIHGMALQFAVGWAGNDLGFVNSLVQSGYNAGSMFINPFITFYVNPDNLSPDLSFGPSKIFSSPWILDRVPIFFAIFGAFCLGFFSLGLVMVREPLPEKYYGEVVDGDDKEREAERVELLKAEGMVEDSQATETYVTIEGKVLSNPKPHTLINSRCDDTPRGSYATCGVADKSPIEMIKTKTFATLCISLMMYDNAMLILANYYKKFGSTRIDNDHFLTYLGSVLTSTTVVAFPFWGVLTDRVGVKKTLIFMYGVSSILSLTMFFTPRIHRLAYMLNIACLGSFLTPIYSVLIISTCKLFGKTHYSSNIGVVASLSLLCNLVNPIIFEAILHIGWFYVFCYGGCLTTTALVFIVVTMPDI